MKNYSILSLSNLGLALTQIIFSPIKYSGIEISLVVIYSNSIGANDISLTSSQPINVVFKLSGIIVIIIILVYLYWIGNTMV